MATLTDEDFNGHMFIVGSTGAGKSNLLLYMMQHLASGGNTIISVDPHGDLALEQKGTIPQTEVYDPILSPFALNPMDIGTFSGEEERKVLVQRRVGELVDMMKDLFGVEQSRAPRLLWIFRGLLYYLYTLSDSPTFLDLYFLLSDLLSDPSRVKRLMRGSDEIIRKSAEAMAELEPTAFTAVMNRISNFVIPAGSYTSKTFCTRKTTVDFLALTEEGKVSAFRLARNLLPDDFRRVLTATIILNVFFAVEKRKKVYDEKGMQVHPVYLVIDEFQNIAELETLDIILSEARKFGLFLITANQHLSQIPENLLKSMEGNARLLISFRVGPDDAHEIARTMGNPKLESILATLPNYTAMIKRMDRVFYFKAPKAGSAPERLHELERGIITNAHLEEDRNPVYTLKGTGPPMAPSQWAVLSHLFLHGPQVAYESIKNEFFKKYAWDESVTLSAINFLLDMGYIRSSRSVSAVYYTLAQRAIDRFFGSTENIVSPRAGGAMHNEIIRKLVRQFWEMGYFTDVDTGSEAGEKPDILVFRPAEKIQVFRELAKAMRDPVEWDRPAAYEVETMSNSMAQIRHNLEKNLERGYEVVFVVPDEDSAKKLEGVLGKAEYSVIVG